MIELAGSPVPPEGNSSTANPFFADIAFAVDEVAFSKGYTTLLCSSNWNVEIERKQLEQLYNQRVDGIIYKPAGKNPMDLSRMSIPNVLLSCIPGENESYIEVDNYKGGQIAADHLISCGYQNFAFIGGTPDSSSNEKRINGYYDRLKECGKQISRDHVIYGGFTVESGYKMAQKLFSAFPDVDGIFCGNDIIALGVLQYLMEINRKIPEETGVPFISIRKTHVARGPVMAEVRIGGIQILGFFTLLPI